MPRLFIAVWPPDEVVERIGVLHRKDTRGVRFVPPENWHVTVRFLGTSDPADVLTALEAGDFPTATAVVGPAVDVLGERAIVLPVRQLDDLANRVVGSTRFLGDPPPRRPFRGHLTIARLRRRGIDPRRMPRIIGETLSATWPVTDIALVESRRHPDGARYETLATIPLGPAAEA